MRKILRYILIVFICLLLSGTNVLAQKLLPFRLPDCGQSTSFTATFGEDADYVISPMSYTDNGNGTITDNTTGLMWQKSDGGEMTWENAVQYSGNLVLGGFSDWRLPTSTELFSINDYNHLNPSLNTVYFPQTLAEYWWTSQKRADDTTKVWVVNAGGGIGAHPKTETLSAGGTKRFHVRAVRSIYSTVFNVNHFTNPGNGTIRDNFTGLVWQKLQTASTMNWNDALVYAENSSLAGYSDWRLPNLKELQSLNDVNRLNPSFNNQFFPDIVSGNFWSSTSMQNNGLKAWDINVQYGIVSYNDKTIPEHVLLVRGGLDNSYLNVTEVNVPGGEFEMGDHHGFIDPNHPSDEIPLHTVKVDSFSMATTETTNDQFLAFLNQALLDSMIVVQNNIVRFSGDTNIVCYTNQYAAWYSISFNGTIFTMADFRAYHPMVGVMWTGAAAFCNWLSTQNGLQPCYNQTTWDCDFTKNGYRLPTEAEWELAGRAGHFNPYFNYPTGDSLNITLTNIPSSGDPYEVGSFPNTTPVGFYNGMLKQKSDYNWPGTSLTYQTSDGANSFNLYDMQGNVWELINDWYGQNYYSVSPYNNPTGPASGFIMPDGKPYRGMRGGNWYNGYLINGVSDGHSRVSNRNPSYYRGPQDPNHPWYHVGFRIARKYSGTTGFINTDKAGNGVQVYPNPSASATHFNVILNRNARLCIQIYSITGQIITTLVNEEQGSGIHNHIWMREDCPAGIYAYVIRIDGNNYSGKLILK